jgi:hypothetical protein
MSSPKAAARPARRAKALGAKALRPVPAASAVASPLSEQATALAAAIERALADGRTDLLSPQAFQALMAALCRTYTVQMEAGSNALPLEERGSVANTDVMIMASALLRSANLAVFELGMWQSWTGR